MTKQQMISLMTEITKTVIGDEDEPYSHRGTAPVKLQIGFVNNIVMSDGIVLLDAPQAITETVMNWIDEHGKNNPGLPVQATAGHGGLFIR